MPIALGEDDKLKREERIAQRMPIIVQNLARIRLGLAIQRFYRAKGRRIVKIRKGLRMYQLFKLRREAKMARWGRFGRILIRFVAIRNHARAWKAKAMRRAENEKELKRSKEEKLGQWSRLAKWMFIVAMILRQGKKWLATARRAIIVAQKKGKGKEKVAESTTVAEATEILQEVVESMQAAVVARQEEDEVSEEGEVAVARRTSKIPPLCPPELSIKTQLLRDIWARKFYNKLNRRNMEAERPFHSDVCQMFEFREYMDRRGLGKMMEVEDFASWEIMREFYSNLNSNLREGKDLVVLVRGQMVDFSAKGINRYLGLDTDVEEDEDIMDYLNLLEADKDVGSRAWMTTIFGPNHESVYAGGKTKPRSLISYSQVDPQYHPFLNWISSRVFPSSHKTTLPVRYIYVLAKISKGPCNIGAYIAWSMKRIATKAGINLGHAHLIRDICASHGIHLQSTEKIIAPGRPIFLNEAFCNVMGWLMPTLSAKGPTEAKEQRKRKKTTSDAGPARKKQKKKATQAPLILISSPDMPADVTEAQRISYLETENKVIRRELAESRVKIAKLEKAMKKIGTAMLEFAGNSSESDSESTDSLSV